MTKKRRIAFAGGGTGGHVYPIENLIIYANQHKEIRDQIDSIFWFGSKNTIEEQSANSVSTGIPPVSFINIHSGKIRRQRDIISIVRNIYDIFLFSRGCIQSIYYLWKYKIDSIFCKGGYVALPVVIAGALLSIKIYAHESDTRPGLVNKIASLFAKRSFTGFPDTLKNSIHVGQIIAHHHHISSKDASKLATSLFMTKKNPLGERQDKTIIFMSGGSQGSHFLHIALVDMLKNLSKKEREQSLFVISVGFINKIDEELFAIYDNVLCFPYLRQRDMAAIFKVSDICIVRGGTTTLAEAKIHNCPCIIVPLSITHDQKRNAQRYKKIYKDIVLSQEDKQFNKKLHTHISQYIGQKKTIPTGSQKDIVDLAKKIIWQEILPSKIS